MSSPIFSNHWYRVAKLKPELKGHIRIHRHDYRDEIWFILEDKTSGRFHRFNRKAYEVIGLFDGQRTTQDIWDIVNTKLGDDAPTQDQVIELLSKLHGSDLLVSNVQPDADEIVERKKERIKNKLKEKFMNPMSLRFSLFDPDAFLDKTLKYVNPFITKTFFFVWLAIITIAFITMLYQWEGLTHNVVDRMLSAQNILILWLVYPIIKIFHELGHAYTAKKWGGEVHSMGFVLLVLIPFPFVDASSASSIRERKKRMVVGAAGMMVELFLASIALFVWVLVDSSIIQAICFNIMLIGCVSTLVFNGNPLLKYDGYYIFSDFIEIPNLTNKSKKYLGYLAQKYFLKVHNLRDFEGTSTEKFWFATYGILAFIYRLFIVLMIAGFVATKFFVVGILLACWGLMTQLVWPFIKQINFLINDPKLRKVRFKAITKTAGSVLALIFFLGVVPIPQYTNAQGVIWLPDDAIIRAGAEGFIENVKKPNNNIVNPEQIIASIHDPNLEKKNRVLLFRLKELKAKLAGERQDDVVKMQTTQEEIKAVKAELTHGLEKQHKLKVMTKTKGRLIIPEASDLEGKYLKNGDIVGYVLGQSKPIVKVAVHQDNMGLIREQITSVEIRTAFNRKIKVDTKVIREYPEATFELPSKALGTQGGGLINIKTNDEHGNQAIEKHFIIDLALPEVEAHYIGSRVYVRFYHGRSPLLAQWYKKVRRIFLRQFDV